MLAELLAVGRLLEEDLLTDDEASSPDRLGAVRAHVEGQLGAPVQHLRLSGG